MHVLIHYYNAHSIKKVQSHVQVNEELKYYCYHRPKSIYSSY